MPLLSHINSLDHEVLDGAVEERVVVVTHLTQPQEVLTGARGKVTVKFKVEVA